MSLLICTHQYAFALFVGDLSFHFNLNLPSIINEQMRALSFSLGRADIDLFPLRYETDLHFDGEPNLSGFINM